MGRWQCKPQVPISSSVSRAHSGVKHLDHKGLWSCIVIFTLGFLCCNLCLGLLGLLPEQGSGEGSLMLGCFLIAPVPSPSEGLRNCWLLCWHVSVEQALQSWFPHHKSAVWATQPSWCPCWLVDCCGQTLLTLSRCFQIASHTLSPAEVPSASSASSAGWI